jgi:alpha-tubulin suppressor-like RCC1 family protein
VFGQVGDNTTTRHHRAPVSVVQGAVTFAGISAGTDFTCGRTSAGQAWCWGRNQEGQLGDNTVANRAAPVAVQQGGLAFAELAAGELHACGRTAAGRLYCWGDNLWGELGDNTRVDRRTPVAVQRAP